MSTKFETIEYTVEDRVATLTLNRPQARNALDVTMRDELKNLLPEIRADKSLCALVITGVGGAFCAGGDLKALSEQARPATANFFD